MSKRKKTKHSGLSWLLTSIAVWTILLGFIPVMHALAADTLSVTNLGTSTKGDEIWSLSGTNATVELTTTSSTSCGSTTYSEQSATLVLTNNYTSDAILTFKYSAEASCTLTIDGSAVSVGDYSETISAGQEVTIVATSSTTTTGSWKFALNDISLTEKVSTGITFMPVEGVTYSVNGTQVVNDSITIDGEVGTKYTITVDTGNYYCAFLNWTDGTNSGMYVLDASYQIQPTQTCEITPVFVYSEDGVAPFMVGTTAYWTWDAAFIAAGAGTVVMVDDYELPVDLLGNLLSENGRFVTYDQVNNTISYTIPENATLLIPYTNGKTSIGSATYTDESGGLASTWIYANNAFTSDQYDNGNASDRSVAGILEPNTNVYLNFIVPSGAIVNVNSGSKLVIGGTIVSGSKATGGVCGATAGKHSNVTLNGTLNINANGILSCCGYILGLGDINVIGGIVYQPFIMADYHDGHYTANSTKNGIFPANRYAMQNIQAPITISSGGRLYGYVDIYTQETSAMGYTVKARHNVADQLIIGTTSDDQCLLKLASGTTLTSTFDPDDYVVVTSSSSNLNNIGYYSKFGKTTLNITGDASLGYMKVSVNVPVIGEQTSSSTNTDFPLPYHYDIYLNKGTYTIGNNLMLMPGVTMKVGSEANLIISGGKFAVMDGLRDYSHTGTPVTTSTWPEYHYPATSDLQNNRSKGDYNGMANLIVEGSLTVNSGASFGGYVQTSGSGIVTMNGTPSVTVGVGNVQYYGKVLGVAVVNYNAGRTERTLGAWLYTTDGNRISMASGKKYCGVDGNTHAVDKYSYRLYTTADNTNVYEDLTAPLNASIVGSWKCAEDSHEYSEVVTSSTCTNMGYTTHTCTVCGDIYTDAETPATGHTSVTDVAVAPTCTATGLTEGSHCSVCGEVLVAQEVVQATGHTEETLAAVAPTCTATGLTEGSKCSVCGETIVAQKVVDALGHSYKAEVTTDSTCTSTGVKTFTCTICGDTYTETIGMKDHTWVNSVCSVCGGTCNHSDHKEVEVTAPTCTEGGYTTYTCNDCGITYAADITEAKGHAPGAEATCTEAQKCTICGEVIVEALGHNYSVTVIAPTCTEAGFSTHTCSTCGDTYRSDETSALGHTEVTDAAVAPTCTEEGLTEGKRCIVCGVPTVPQEVVSALGHTEEIDAAVAATCTSTGLTEGKHCSVCSQVLVAQEEVPALGHTEVADAAVAPTCTETGLTEGSHCSVCGEVIIAQGVIPVIDHQYEGDSCSQCGAAKPAITQVGRTLRYEDKISIIYIFDVNSEVYSQKQEAGLLMWTEQDYAAANGTYTQASASKTYRGMSAYDWGGENSSTYYYAESSGLLAAELDEIRYYAGYVKTADGSYMISDITTYSPAEYAYNMIKKYTGSDETSTRQETYDLCIALLNYISAGQQYFRAPDTAAIAEENLVNYDLRNMGKDGADLRVMKHTWIKEDIPELKLAEETVETERTVAGGVSNIFTKAGGNLLFGDMVSMGSLYEISKPATVENADAAGTIIWTEAQWNNPDFAGEISISTGNVGGGEQKAFAAYPGLVNTYYSLTPQMAPKEMADTKYYFLGYLVEEIVAEGEETATVTHYSAIKAYTVEEYIYNTVNSETATDEMKELAKRLYYYERAAKAALPGKS